MALPLNSLSQVAIYYAWLGPDQPDPQPLIDYDLGGIALNDNSAGLQYQIWEFTAVGKQVYVQAPNTTGPTLLFTTDDTISIVRGTFDQNMNPMVAYLKGSQWYFWWFDTVSHSMVTSLLPADVTSCTVAFDDRRTLESNLSDVLIFYTRNENLYYIRQRDRYNTEYLLRASVHATLVRTDMSAIYRMQFKMQAERL